MTEAPRRGPGRPRKNPELPRLPSSYGLHTAPDVADLLRAARATLSDDLGVKVSNVETIRYLVKFWQKRRSKRG